MIYITRIEFVSDKVNNGGLQEILINKGWKEVYSEESLEMLTKNSDKWILYKETEVYKLVIKMRNNEKGLIDLFIKNKEGVTLKGITGVLSEELGIR